MLTSSIEQVLENIIEHISASVIFPFMAFLMYSRYVNNKTEQHQKNCVALQIILFWAVLCVYVCIMH